MVLHLNKRSIIAFLAVISAVLILGAVIYNAATPSPTPTETPSPNPNMLVVPDDYLTITAAIGNATDGDTIFVKNGTYESPRNQTLVINKTLSLIGEDAKDTKINLHPPLVPMSIFTYTYMGHLASIKVDANDVKISGFTINTPGGGITVTGDRIQIIGNNITTSLFVNGFYSTVAENILKGRIRVIGSNQTVTQNIIEGDIECNGSYNNITGNTIRDKIDLEGSSNIISGNSVPSIVLEYSDLNTISNNTCGHLWLGGYGHTCSYNTVSGNVIRGPGLWGILLSDGSYNVFHDNYIADFRGSHDGYGVAFGGYHFVAEKNTFYHNTFVNNNKGVGYNWDLLGTGNFWDNGKEGNYWSDYTGTDDNGDGIGDTPYVINGENIDHFPLMAPFDISG